ncbi:SDR family oxidoreductase [Mycolicibacterium sp. P1-18]|uniref:SDR family oxidoreductase n=1 Tax=Mycolicibacterium sp. P1-18 TaxID=2024615 RepID=UPI0011F0E7C4|nr:SDR family oxidoreductase [Mycolicibacterium sp. P1-18]KAA0092109.1 SDR family oxidoreductase [Mycolicibacterium sp. P1-18]
MTDVTARTVTGADGVRIAVYEQGNPDGPTIVMVHGWPDSHVVWDGVVALLEDRYRIVRYDNRGVGGSDVPRRHSAYTMARFADDVDAVIGAVSPAGPVHVLAHDWGSVGVWEYLARPEAEARVASFTSISGPSTDHLNRFVVGGLARPYAPRRFARALTQLLRLTYMIGLSVPALAPAVVRWLLHRGLLDRMLGADGVPADRRHRSADLVTDAANSVKVYRANVFGSLTHARPDHRVDVPVQLVVATGDPFIRPYAFDQTPAWASRLWRRDVTAGHWVQLSHPKTVADSVAEFVDHLHGAAPARALLRAQVGRARDTFGDSLVSVTGAGSGIGRATALAFAERGAEIVVSDVDEASVAETASLIADRGGVAHHYVLDVSDADAVEAFADRVCTAHGVPDVVVNNAGIGHAGSFLDTPAEQWDRVLEVNLGGVVNGCRAFAKRLVERGTGGHVVNVSSMAAYAPLQAMNAYCTSKAAVYMFSDCLRAELDAAGVGLTTICPGVINTNIVQTTRFDAPAGRGGKVAGRRKQLEALFAARRYGPDKVATAIVTSVVKNTAIRPVAPEAYLLYGTSRVAPQVLRSTARGSVM